MAGSGLSRSSGRKAGAGNVPRLIDVTRPLAPDGIVYSGDTVPEFRQRDSGTYLISDIRISSHSGTHIDAPVHYLKKGMPVDEIPLPAIIGECRVLDLTQVTGKISAEDLKDQISGSIRLLLKTRYSGIHRFDPDYPCLDLSAARLLTEKGVRCVGIDSPSIEEFNCDGSVHRELLGNGCIIIELLDLSQVSAGTYDLVALPLPLRGMDGSPARVILCEKGA